MAGLRDFSFLATRSNISGAIMASIYCPNPFFFRLFLAGFKMVLVKNTFTAIYDIIQDMMDRVRTPYTAPAMFPFAIQVRCYPLESAASLQVH